MESFQRYDAVTTARYDVFLSYSSADSEWVQNLANELADEDVNFFLDLACLEPGQNFVSKLSEAIKHSRFLVLVISPSSIESPWVLREWSAFLDENGPTDRLLPLVLEPVEIPSILKPIQAIDATNRNAIHVAREISRIVGRTERSKEDAARLTNRSHSQDTWLRLPSPTWRLDRSTPGALLQPEYGIVPFHGREAELADLQSWCASSEALRARLYTGPGGMGKTRLLLATCRSLVSQGWQAGFLSDPSPFQSPEQWATCLNRSGETLIVVDYAERRRHDLSSLLAGSFYTSKGKLRIVLLARSAGAWWDRLRIEGNGVDELLKSPAMKVQELFPLASTLETRQQSIRIAAHAFAAALSTTEPETAIEDAEIEASHYRRALLLHMQALAMVLGDVVRGEKGVLDFVLGRERRYWAKLAEAAFLPSDLSAEIPRVMAVATLTGGIESRSRAIEILRRLPWFQGQPLSILGSLADVLHESSPGERWIEPLAPDLLGEHLLECELNAEDLDAVFPLFDKASS